MKKIMSYAQADGSGAHAQEKYYNGNLLVCHVGTISYDKITEALHKEGYWKHVQVFQTVDLHRRYAVEFKGIYIRPKWKVFISQLPSGITNQETRTALQSHGVVRDVQAITKTLYERRYDTGDRLVIFSALSKDIPSYLDIKGWKAFIRYNNQLKTCRICEQTGHFAKDSEEHV